MSIFPIADFLYKAMGSPNFMDLSSPGRALQHFVPKEVQQSIPVVKQVNQLIDEQQFWKDYKETTGYSPRYPGRQVHGADVQDIAGAIEWWL